jgi:transcriptional antiterminator Rof (Rho-off)
MALTAKPTEVKAGRFRFFISYAREDYNIAIAVNNAIQTAAGPAAEVFMDFALQFGLNFQEEIKSRLDQTNVLVVIHSGILRSAFEFPGLELGYFLRVMESEPSPDFPRRIVPIYLDKPPDAIASDHGVNVGISRATLSMSVEEYRATLENIDFDHATVKLLRQFQQLVNTVREQHGLAKLYEEESQRNLPCLVAKMQLAIFTHLKNTLDPEGTLKPQYQITIRTNDDALRAGSDNQLPADARLVPMGNGTMSIFGLAPAELTWEDFQKQTKASKFCDSWVDAITKVVTSSLRNQLAKDNSQVIVSYDEKLAYRVILTTGVRYFNGDREFNIYFVEALRKRFGDYETTVVFEGLELACRFRSLFLEQDSEFSSSACELARPDAVKELASEMEHELNLLRRDAVQAGLDEPAVWLGLIDPDILVRVARVWRPLEESLRDVLRRTRKCETETIESCRQALIPVLKDIERAMRSLNAEVIAAMADKLKTAPSA